MIVQELLVCALDFKQLNGDHQISLQKVKAMNASLINRLRKFYDSVTTMDPATVRMLETTHVEVRRSSRLWGV
jgi:hypothetical protein